MSEKMTTSNSRPFEVLLNCIIADGFKDCGVDVYVMRCCHNENKPDMEVSYTIRAKVGDAFCDIDKDVIKKVSVRINKLFTNFGISFCDFSDGILLEEASTGKFVYFWAYFWDCSSNDDLNRENVAVSKAVSKGYIKKGSLPETSISYSMLRWGEIGSFSVKGSRISAT